MKASLRNDKGSCNHNDRSFNTDKAEHLKEGSVYVYSMGSDGQWESCPTGHYELDRREKQRYKHLFGQHFDNVNARYREQGHGEKVKSLEHHRKGRYAPIETIFQIGKEGEWQDPNSLLSAVNNTLGKMKQRLGDNMELLSIAIHCDEQSIHVHARWVIVAHDKNGLLVPDKENGLKEANVELPEPDKKSSRDNNRMVAFTDYSRNLWYDEVDKLLAPYEMTIDRETDPKNRSRRNKRVQEHRAEELGRKVEELENELLDMEHKFKRFKVNLKVEFEELIKDFKSAIKQVTNDYDRRILMQKFEDKVKAITQSFETNFETMELENDFEEWER